MNTLSGCLVVRNGKRSIVPCLDALLKLVDEYVLVDTGSTDGTDELIQNWLSKHPDRKFIYEKVGGKFHDSDGNFDFGAAKNYALSLATCSHVIWCDVNDICSNPAGMRNAFEKITRKIPNASITMLTKVSDMFSFPRVRIAPREYANFVGSIHEYMVNGAPGAQLVTTKFEMVNYKMTRDIGRNIKALEKEWMRERSQRTAFYMGNSYNDVMDYRSAAIWYSITVDEFPEARTEERFKSMEMLCECATKFKFWSELGSRSMQMIEERPDRMEGYYYRAKYQFHMKDYAMTRKCLEKAISLADKSAVSSLWVNRAIYDRRHLAYLRNELETQIRISQTEPMQPEHISTYNGGMGMPFGGMMRY